MKIAALLQGFLPAGSAPIPTPAGYDVPNFYCYNVKDPSDPSPPGYNLSNGSSCGSTAIKAWSDGTPSGYGQLVSDQGLHLSNPDECAKVCNQHKECGGFFYANGRCSHWQAVPLNATVSGNGDCFEKIETKDLCYVTSQEPAPPRPVKEPTGSQISDCLCIFDIDRTLTAQQGQDCPGTGSRPEVWDYGYNGGQLQLSELAVNINKTFCGQCYFAVVSAGTGGGPNSDMRKILDGLVDPKYNVGGWNDGCPTPTWGTKQTCCGEGSQKSGAARDIVNWLQDEGITIEDENVHFFDDKENNVEAFINETFNAHQVSCGSRDGNKGNCGGRSSEVVTLAGKHFCDVIV